MSLSAFILTTALEPTNAARNLAFQEISMRKLFRDRPSISLYDYAVDAYLVRPGEANDICSWAYVICADGNVTELRWQRSNVRDILRFAKFDISWLPPTLTHVYLQNRSVNSRFDARKLPRGLLVLDLSSCVMFGDLKLENLPANIRTLRLAVNSFSGTVQLTELPPELRFLGLQHNRFDCVTVANYALPVHLESINLQDNILKMKVVEVRGDKTDERIRF